MTICSSSGIETVRLREETPMPDVFQAVYFGNVASLYQGKEIFQLRRELGQGLAALYSDPEVDNIDRIYVPSSDWRFLLSSYLTSKVLL